MRFSTVFLATLLPLLALAAEEESPAFEVVTVTSTSTKIKTQTMTATGAAIPAGGLKDDSEPRIYTITNTPAVLIAAMETGGPHASGAAHASDAPTVVAEGSVEETGEAKKEDKPSAAGRTGVSMLGGVVGLMVVGWLGM